MSRRVGVDSYSYHRLLGETPPPYLLAGESLDVDSPAGAWCRRVVA